MTDPAVEAAQRAVDAMESPRIFAHDLVAAAREALRPIREWMAELDSEELLPAHVVIAALAPLIYATEELQS